MTKVRRQFMLLAIPCFIGIGWMFVHYHKNQKLIVRYRQEIKNLEKQQRALLKARTTNTQLEQSIKNLKITLRSPKKAFAIHDTKQPAPQTIAIARKAQTLGLHLNSCVVQKRKNKNWFIKQNVLYEFTGTKKQICQFIEELQNGTYILRCKHLSTKKPMDQKIINLSCTLQFLSLKSK